MDTKSTVTLDEAFDAVFCRPLGKRLAEFFAQYTSLSANHVSALGGILGACAGMCFASTGVAPAYGAAFLLCMLVVDCSDGELARKRGALDWRGRAIDGLADMVTSISVHLGMLFALYREGVTIAGYTLSFWQLFLLAIAAGYSMAWNAFIVDDIKQNVRGNPPASFGRNPPPLRSLSDRLLYLFLSRYESKRTRCLSTHVAVSPQLFQRVQWVGPTHHSFAMVLTGLCMTTFPQAPLAYFLCALVPANLYLWLVVGLRRHRSLAHE